MAADHLDFRPTKLVKRSIWNLAGQLAPLVLALISIPVIVSGLGVDRFGLLLLTWATVGYFSLLDFGIGRALVQAIAKRIHSATPVEISTICRTGLVLLFLLGLFGALLVFFAAPYLSKHLLNVPPALHGEFLSALYIVALTIPIVTVTAGAHGALEAHQRFDLTNMIRIPISVLSYSGQMIAAILFPSLVAAVAVLFFVRLIGLALYLIFVFRRIASRSDRTFYNLAIVRELFRFGSWQTVSNIVGPLMVYLDRFFIGAVISTSAIAFYATPYEIVTKLWIFPTALLGVLFPTFSSLLHMDRRRTVALYAIGLKVIFIAILPLSILFVGLAEPMLDFWLGAKFAENSTVVLQVLAFGVFINCLAQISFALIQSAGRPDITAKLHLLELTPYLLLLTVLTTHFGIIGAAVAWTVRVGADAFALTIASMRIIPELRHTPSALVSGGVISCICFLLLTISQQSPLNFIITALAFLTSIGLSWLFLFDTSERRSLFEACRSLLLPAS